MRFDFARNKYKKEVLIDCFMQSEQIGLTEPSSAFFVTFYEVIFVVSGTGVLLLDDEEIPFKEGNVLFLPPNKWRRWLSIDQTFEAHYLLFEEEFIATFFNDPLYLYRFNYFYNTSTPSFLTLKAEEFQNYSTTLNDIKRELHSLKQDSKHLLRAYLYTLLINLNRLYEQEHNIQESFYQETDILKFRKLLEEHIQSKHRVAEYAELLQISTSHLNKLVKKYVGKNCSDLIRERRIFEIKKELQFTNKTISEISHELGFSESSNFIRFFQNHVGISPKTYRTQNDNS